MEYLAKTDQSKLIKAQQHWTVGDPLRLVRSISADFIAQIEMRIEHLDGFTRSDLAKRLNVSLGRVSQMMNSPGNFTLKNGVMYAGAVSMKMAVVTYPDDSVSNGGPISGDVFRACWEIAGRPTNMFEVGENTVGIVAHCGGMAAIGHTWGTPPINLGGGTRLPVNCTAQTDSKQRLSENLSLTAQATS
jgi:hypothetical protein